MTKNIVSRLFLSLLSTLLLSCEKSPEKTQPSVSVNEVVPQTSVSSSTFQDLQGRPVEISDYLGKKVILNYWATWCAPCIREIPSLSKAAEILKDEGFIFLLASDESIEDIFEFVEEHEFENNFIKLNTFFASFGVEAVPSTVLYNDSGEIINTWLGEYEWDSEEVLASLRKASSAPKR